MSVNITYVEGASILRHILRSHKIRSTFYTEKTFLNSFVNLKIKQIQKIKTISFIYEIDCSICEAVYFGESKRSLKSRSDEHKRSVRDCDFDKNEIAKEADHNFNWNQKVIDRESRLIPRKIKETIHSLKNPNHINKISYMLPEIWLPNLRQFLVSYLCHIRRFQLMTLTQSRHFCVRKGYCLITLIFLTILISHMTQLLLSLIVSVQVRIFPLNMRGIIIYVAPLWEKYFLKRSLTKRTCS